MYPAGKLAAVLGLGAGVYGGRPFDTGPRPWFYNDTLWGFMLEELSGERTRLVVSGYASERPRPLLALGDFLFWEPAHWIMQRRQFANIKRCAERQPVPEAAEAAVAAA